MDCRTDTADSLSWITRRCGDHVDRASASPSDKNRGSFHLGPRSLSAHRPRRPHHHTRVRSRGSGCGVPEPISCIRRTGCGVGNTCSAAVRRDDAQRTSEGKCDMRRVVAIANGKGGVGKTTLTAGLAGRLAADGRRVLVVDTDPQGNHRSRPRIRAARRQQPESGDHPRPARRGHPGGARPPRRRPRRTRPVGRRRRVHLPRRPRCVVARTPAGPGSGPPGGHRRRTTTSSSSTPRPASRSCRNSSSPRPTT